MTMRLFNTMSRTEEDFTPGSGNTVRMYTCGLTVYARGHVGNFRMFTCVDVLRRTLRHLLGYEVQAGRQLHRRRRPDHCRRPSGRPRPAHLHRPIHRRVPRGLAFARPRGGRGNAAGDRPGQPAGDGRSHHRARPPTVTPTAATDRSTSRSRRCPTTGSWRISITTACRPARGSTPTPTRKTMPAISCCGRRPSRTSRPGTWSTRRVDPAGISNARRWRCGCSASRRSTSIPAASI